MEQDMMQGQSFWQRRQAALARSAFICQMLEASVVVFTRRNFGRRYFGVHTACVIPVVLLWSLFFPAGPVFVVLVPGRLLAGSVCGADADGLLSRWR